MLSFRRSTRVRQARLDPVRARPRRGTFVRLCAAAVLLGTAAFLLSAGPPKCSPAPTDGAASRTSVTNPTAIGQTAPGQAASGPAANGPASATTDPTASAGELETPAGEPQPSGPPASRPSPDSAEDEQSDGRAPIPAGKVGVPVRLAEPATLALVHPGDIVDLLRVPSPHPTGEPGEPAPVATGATVLAVTGADDPASGGLLLALSPDQAHNAVNTTGGTFAVLIRQP